MEYLKKIKPYRYLVAGIVVSVAVGCQTPDLDVHQHTAKIESMALTLSDAEREDLQFIANERGWSLDKAIARIGWQTRFADFAAEIRARYPDRFAGAAITPDQKFDAFIGFRDEVPDALHSDSRLLGLQIEFRSHRGYSEADLQKQLIELNASLHKAGYRDVVSSYEVERGVIEVELISAEVAQLGQVPATLNASNVVYHVVDELPGGALDLFGGGRMEWPSSGSRMCTAAFALQLGGALGMATAGHCSDSSTQENESGDIEHTTIFEDEHMGSHGDLQWHSFSTDTPSSFFYQDWGVTRDAWRAPSIFKGMSICKFGHTTGKSCDEVYKTSVSVNYDCCPKMDRLVATKNNNADSGDSGGPWYYGNNIYGVTSGYKTIWFKKRDLFSQINYTDEVLGGARPLLCESRTQCFSYECGTVSVGCGRTINCGPCNGPCEGSVCPDASCCPLSGVCPGGLFCAL